MALLQQWPVERPPNGTMIELTLLGDFGLVCDGCAGSPPETVQRLLALLALWDQPLSRGFIAGTLWLDASDQQAGASLRSALWRLRKARADLVVARPGHRLALGPQVSVDVHRLVDAAEQLRSDVAVAVAGVAEQLFEADLLPGWHDEWLEMERERLRQIRLAALEHLADRRLSNGDVVGAIRAGTSAVRCGPLRESSHRVLVRAHIADGNYSEAIRQYEHYRRSLADHLGLTPSPHIQDLMGPLLCQLRSSPRH
jgi:DNA-binding SARP family transcriptional activator